VSITHNQNFFYQTLNYFLM